MKAFRFRCEEIPASQKLAEPHDIVHLKGYTEYCTILYYTILHYTTLYYTILYYTILCDDVSLYHSVYYCMSYVLYTFCVIYPTCMCCTVWRECCLSTLHFTLYTVHCDCDPVRHTLYTIMHCDTHTRTLSPYLI